MAQKVLNSELYEEILVRPSPGSPPIPVDIGTSGTVNIHGDVVAEFNDVEESLGLRTDPAAQSDGENTGLIALIKRLLGKVPAPVNGAVPISASALPLPSGAATAANQSTLIGHVDGLEGAIGATDDPAANADTGTFSLNALIKRGLANWTTLLTRIPTLTLSGSRLQVDGSGVTQPVNGTVATTVAVRTPTTTSVASSATSVTILAANANRRGVSIANDSTATLRLSFATPATAANAFIVLPPGAFILLDQQMIVTGIIYGIWSAANGTAQVTEYI